MCYATLHLLILSVNCLISLLVGHILLFLSSDVKGSMSCRTRVNRYIRPSFLPKSQPFGPNPIPNHSLKAFIQAQWLKSKNQSSHASNKSSFLISVMNGQNGLPLFYRNFLLVLWGCSPASDILDEHAVESHLSDASI